MKHKHILPILLMGALGLQSCSDFLDTKPTEGYPETTVWETQGTVDAFVTRKDINPIALILLDTGYCRCIRHRKLWQCIRPLRMVLYMGQDIHQQHGELPCRLSRRGSWPYGEHLRLWFEQPFYLYP